MPKRRITFPTGPAHITITTRGHTTGRITIIVTNDPDAKPEAVFRGDRETLEDISVRDRGDNTINIEFPGNPNAAGNHISVGDVTINGGGFFGSVVGGVGNVFVSGNNHGAISGNRIIINGRDVTHLAEAPALTHPVDATITLPPGSSINTNTAGTEIHTQGPLTSANVTTINADIHIDEARSITARSISGDITILTIPAAGIVSAHTTSGDIHAETVLGMGNLRTVSGDLTVVTANPDGALDLNTVSGDITYGISTLDAVNRVRANTVSGRIRTHTR